MSMSDGVGLTGGGSSLARRPVVAWSVAVAAIVVAVVAVVVLVVREPAAPAPVVAAPVVAAPAAPASTALYGRWVRSGQSCEFHGNDMVVTASKIVNHELGELRSDMKLANVAVKSPGVFEIRFESHAASSFVGFAMFEMKDARTLILSGYIFQRDGSIWLKC